MDSESNYELGIPSSKPPSPIEEASIGSLIRTVEEFQRRDQLETLSKLTEESSCLQQYIVHYQNQWCYTVDLLQNAHDALLALQSSLKKCFHQQLKAEKRWLSFWRLDDGSSNGEGDYNPTGWI